MREDATRGTPERKTAREKTRSRARARQEEVVCVSAACVRACMRACVRACDKRHGEPRGEESALRRHDGTEEHRAT